MSNIAGFLVYLVQGVAIVVMLAGVYMLAEIVVDKIRSL